MNGNDTEESPTKRIIEEVADRKDVDPLNLPPLYDAIDTAALDTLFTPPRDPSCGVLTVKFAYGDHVVTVHDDGRVEISRRTE